MVGWWLTFEIGFLAATMPRIGFYNFNAIGVLDGHCLNCLIFVKLRRYCFHLRSILNPY